VLPFEVGEPAHVRLAVYDVLGREVAVLADGTFEPGRYEAAFDGRSLASGVYVVRAVMEAEGRAFGDGALGIGRATRAFMQRITLLR
jgi:hypothetical protein